MVQNLLFFMMIVSQTFPHVTMVYVKGKCMTFLFAVFMNDIESYLASCNLNGLQTISNLPVLPVSEVWNMGYSAP